MKLRFLNFNLPAFNLLFLGNCLQNKNGSLFDKSSNHYNCKYFNFFCFDRMIKTLCGLHFQIGHENTSDCISRYSLPNFRHSDRTFESLSIIVGEKILNKFLNLQYLFVFCFFLQVTFRA